jgi:hypothetical protein
MIRRAQVDGSGFPSLNFSVDSDDPGNNWSELDGVLDTLLLNLRSSASSAGNPGGRGIRRAVLP